MSIRAHQKGHRSRQKNFHAHYVRPHYLFHDQDQSFRRVRM